MEILLSAISEEFIGKSFSIGDYRHTGDVIQPQVEADVRKFGFKASSAPKRERCAEQNAAINKPKMSGPKAGRYAQSASSVPPKGLKNTPHVVIGTRSAANEADGRSVSSPVK